jgi:hypothetical protein
MVEHATLPEVRSDVEGFLRASFGDAPTDQDDDFVVRRDGVVAWVRTLEMPDGQTAVAIWSVSNLDFRIDPDLTGYLATEGNALDFAQFRLYEDPARLHVTHALLGDNLSREELEVAVDAVTSTASRYGATVKERFGGRRLGEPAAVATAPGMVTVSRPVAPSPADQAMAVRILQDMLGGGAARRRSDERAKRLQGLFAMVALLAGGAAGFLAYRWSSSWALVIFAFLMTTYFVARAIPDLITDEQRVRRLAFFLAMPAVATGVLALTHVWWDRWWLSVLLALTAGLVLGALLANVLFPRIAREEAEDDRRRREEARRS